MVFPEQDPFSALPLITSQYDPAGSPVCKCWLRSYPMISPVAENVIVKGRPWWERYQPVSYNLTTRSGSESQLSDMISRCNKVGIRIYADVIFNHMAAFTGIGTAGNKAMSDDKIYPGVPYTPEDFHPTCNIPNYLDPEVVRNCELNNLRDLDQSTQNVQLRIVTYLNKLIGLGVAGFRVDSAKYIATEQLEEIYSKLNDLNTSFFPPKTRPFIYQDVPVFVVFVDSHNNQRNGQILNYQTLKQYKMALAFMLSHPYGLPRIISSYFFHNKDVGPPQDSDENVKSPIIYSDGSCGNGFVCEHRWPQVRNMVDFRNAVSGTEIGNWWSNNEQQIAFSRGSVGFIAFANGGNLTEKIQTGLAAGTYCDIISGSLVNKTCTGKSVVVDGKGVASVRILESDFEGVVAVFVNSKK
ncbi:Alpha-amylase-related protein-like Protein [Tribolium castaneum]|uniref:Alpha-amylase n=1 Tax=Tribolium castaneum TaxID=7070 RepID=D6W965_TRICA|nr:Alpha-amylase-related protein-like Protein [Tribolium castaneum]